MRSSTAKTLALAAVVVVAFGLSGVATSPVEAQESGKVLADETLSVDNETRSVYALAENTTAGYPINVTVYAVDSNGIETEVANGTLNATSANGTDLFEYTSLDPGNYTSYRVVVTGDGETVERVEVGAVREVTGGGGGLGLGGGSGISPLLLGAAIVLIGGVAYVMRGDMS